MDSLPTEIITHILQFLEPVDIQVASEVCLSFYQSSMHPRLVKNLFMGRKTRCNFARATSIHYDARSRSLDLMIEGHNREKDLTWDSSDARLDLGPEVKQLQLKVDKWISPYLTVIILKDILAHFPHLETLVLKDMNMHRGFLVDGSLGNHLQSLRTLKLCSVGNVLNFLRGPTVDLLSREINLGLESEVLLKKVEENSVRNFSRAISTMTLEELRTVCCKYSSIFTELNMLNSELNLNYTEILIQSVNKQLETLRLAKCNYIDDDTLGVLSDSPLRLKTLVVDGCKPNTYDTAYVTTEGIDLVARRMKSLVNLSFFLREKIRFNPETFSVGFTGLNSVSLMSYGAYHEYCTINMHSGEFSAAHLCKLESPILLKSLADGSPMLQELTLDLICEISDDEVLFICKAFPDLSVLKLNSVCEITDKALLGSDCLKSGKVAEKGRIRALEQKLGFPNRDTTSGQHNSFGHQTGGEVCHSEEANNGKVQLDFDGESRTRRKQGSKMALAKERDFAAEKELNNEEEERILSRKELSEVVSHSGSDEVTLVERNSALRKDSETTETFIHFERDLAVSVSRRSNGSPASDEFKSADCLNSSSCGETTPNGSHDNGSGCCQKRCESGSHDLGVGHRGLRELEKLQTLNLVGCCQLSDEGYALGLKFHALSHLKLTHCENLTDFGVAAIVTNNPSIKTFVLEFCNGLSDGSVRTVLEGLNNLEKVKFDNCSTLTAECLQHVASSKSLKVVWFGSCKIPVAEVQTFKESTSRFKYHDFDW